MDIWDIDKIYLFIAFVIPGFISIKVYELLFPCDKKDSSEQLIDAITYSCINYALLFWLIIEVETSGLSVAHPFFYKIFYGLVLFGFPVIWVLLWRWVRRLEIFLKNAPHPTHKPWDYIFAQRKWYWIIVTLRDGQKIAGKYANNSFASSSPAPEQIYIEETWVLNEDGGFDRPRTDTAGVIVLSQDIATVEFFKYN